MFTRIKKEDLPEDSHMSPDLLENHKEFISIKFYGKPYYIPLPASRKLGKLIVQENETEFERYIQFIISALYLQVRDTVGSEIHGRLSREIEEGLNKMFSQNLGRAVMERLDQKLLPGKEESDGQKKADS